MDKKFREISNRFDKPRSAYQTPEYHAPNKELKRLSYWIDHTEDEAARQDLIRQYKAQKKAMRNLPCKPADNKKFTFSAMRMIGWQAYAEQKRNVKN